MIKLNSDKGREIVSDYISALNGDSENIKWANDKRKAEYDTYDDEKMSIVKVDIALFKLANYANI